MVIVDEGEVERRLAVLADQLAQSGHLRTAAWRKAFLAVRRHVFVPRFWHDEEPGAFPARWRMVDNATRDHGEWLAAVYSDRTLPTELTGVPAIGGEGMHPQVTSSTTMPGLVLAMLEDLDVDDGMRVLEIGTGTGYNAALLCERLGDEHVTTVDLSPELVALATVRLADHGYRPHVVPGDGAAGVPDRAPVDRIIATCGVDQIPQAWIEQTREGGKILANLMGPFNAFGLVLLTVTDGHASGTFLRQSGSFMPRRTDPARAFDHRISIQRATVDVARSHSRLDPSALYTDRTWGLVAQTALRGVVSRRICLDDEDELATELSTLDGSSWALIHHRRDRVGHRVEQSGPRRLWNELEVFYEQWVTLDRPPFHRFGITVGDGREPSMWLDHADGEHTWAL